MTCVLRKCGVAKNKQPGRKTEKHAFSTMHIQRISIEKVMSGATQSVVEQLTNKALQDVN